MIKHFQSNDGTIRLEYRDGYSSIIIPTINNKNTLCVSSQIGCQIGCKFCRSGKFQRNLSYKEIIDQYLDAKKMVSNITSIVFMGMGEPMNNFENVNKSIRILNEKYQISYKKITLSTSGIDISKLIDVKYNIAISLHFTEENIRKKFMPGACTIKEILKFSKKISKESKYGIMIEYTLIKDINDSSEDIKKLINLGFPKNTNFNLIEFNNYLSYKKSENVELFKKELLKNEYKCFVRSSRGNDIDAACGMLACNENYDNDDD